MVVVLDCAEVDSGVVVSFSFPSSSSSSVPFTPEEEDEEADISRVKLQRDSQERERWSESGATVEEWKK